MPKYLNMTAEGIDCLHTMTASDLHRLNGMYEKMAELGSTKYHFFGHDYSNNTSLNYNGIDMTYIQNTGHNKGDKIGGTRIKIDSNKNVTHEIIMGNI